MNLFGESSGASSTNKEKIELRETINSLISEHGFKEIIHELRKYSLRNEEELGLPKELKSYWEKVSELLEQIIEVEEVEDYEPED